MFIVDEATGRIDMHRGDTGAFTISLDGYTLGENDRVMITFMGMGGTEIKKAYYAPVNNQVTVTFGNPETDYLSAGDYKWDVRVVIDPEWDTSGEEPVIVDGAAVSTPMDPMTLHIRATVGQI